METQTTSTLQQVHCKETYLFIICLDYMLRTSIDERKWFKANNNKKKRSRRYPLKTITDADYEVSCMSGSSNLDSFRDGRQVAVQLVPCGVLPAGLVLYCSQHSCVIALQLFLQPFCQCPSSASIQQYRYDRCLEETAFHFIGQV